MTPRRSSLSARRRRGGSFNPAGFSLIATAALGAVGAGAACWPLIDQMNPDAETIAGGAPIDVDLAPLAPGQQILVKWRGHPIFVVNRSPAALSTLQVSGARRQAFEPNFSVNQQPSYADNWHRSVKPEYAVLVGVCTHLGLPRFQPEKGQISPDWLGGYFCPCHGSKYDLAGRVFEAFRLHYNLPVPPYVFVNDKTLRIGANPQGETFELADIVQL